MEATASSCARCPRPPSPSPSPSPLLVCTLTLTLTASSCHTRQVSGQCVEHGVVLEYLRRHHLAAASTARLLLHRLQHAVSMYEELRNAMDGAMLARFEESLGDAFAALHAAPVAPSGGSASDGSKAGAPTTKPDAASAADGATPTVPPDASPPPTADGDQEEDEGIPPADGAPQGAREETYRSSSPPSLAGPSSIL